MEQETSKGLSAPRGNRLAKSVFLASIAKAGSAKHPFSPHESEPALRACISSQHTAADAHHTTRSPIQYPRGGDSNWNAADPDLTVVSLTPTFETVGATKGLLERIADITLALAILTITIPSTVLSFGIPYWYYRCYRLQVQRSSRAVSRTAHEKLADEHNTPDVEKWNKIIRRLKSQWKAFFAISAGALPAVFPMLAVYPDPKCSWASLLAALALFSGLMSMLTAKLSRHFSELYEEEVMMMDWYNASRFHWLHYSTQHFWAFISLPTLWLLSQITTLTATIILAVWEQVTAAPSEVRA